MATVSYLSHTLREISQLIQCSKKNVFTNKLKNVDHKNTKKERVNDIPHHLIGLNWKTSIPGEDKLVLPIMKHAFLFRLREIINAL